MLVPVFVVLILLEQLHARTTTQLTGQRAECRLLRARVLVGREDRQHDLGLSRGDCLVAAKALLFMSLLMPENNGYNEERLKQTTHNPREDSIAPT